MLISQHLKHQHLQNLDELYLLTQMFQFNLYNRNMYKPTLKRTTALTLNTMAVSQDHLQKNIQEQTTTRLSFSSPMIPNRMLEAPQNRNKEKKHIIAPLMVKSHNYPKKILQRLESEDEREKTRGIGGYREINWFFQGKILTLWITDKEDEVELAFDEDINAVTMGELKSQYLPSKLRNKYIIAVGCLNTVTLYSLNSFSLQAFPAGVKYTIQYSIQVEKIKFINQNKILVATNTGYVKLIEFDETQSKKGLKMPFYRQFVPVTIHESTKSISQLLYTPSKIYTLTTQYKSKSWLAKSFQFLISDTYVDPIQKKRYIQVYEITNKIQKKERIYEDQLLKKIKNHIPDWKKGATIKSIYIDYQHQKEGELGIVTECGCFVTVRNHSSEGREPLFVPNVGEIGQCEFISQKKLQFMQLNNETNSKVISSLGYENLTLLEDSLLWIGEDRIDAVLSSHLVGELFQKNEYQSKNMLERNQEWGMFGFKNYFTIKQLPIRHLIAIIFYIKSNLTNEYSGFHYKEDKFNSFMEKYISILSPDIFLKYLIQIVVSQERFITINPYFIELIESELKEEKAKEFKDWKHFISASLKKQQIFINENMLQHIWSTIIEMQSREMGSNSSRFVNLYQSNVFWMTMQRIYHNLISPLFQLHPEDFRKNKTLVEDIHQVLKSIGTFFEKKRSLEASIRGSFVTGNDKKDLFSNSLDNTVSSISENEVSWLPENIRRSVATRALNENYLILLQKVQSAFKATSILMTIFYNLQDYIDLKEGNNSKKYCKIFSTTFKQVLSSRDTQKQLKKLLILKLQYNDLSEIDKSLPSFALSADLSFLRCLNKLKLEQKSKDQLDLNQIAENINSDYFQDIQSVLQKRYDLKLKMLGLYQERILNEKENLVKSNTLQERNLISKTFFPEDEEEVLKFRRDHIDKELDQVLLEQKKCISKAILNHSEFKNNSKGNLTPVIDQIIIYVSTKPYLFLYTEQELRAASLIRELGQLQRIKPSKMPSSSFSSQIRIKPQYIKRDLFPPLKPY